MRKRYKDVHFSLGNFQRLATINKIIEEYAAQGFRLTLRQLYYQLVSRDVVPNQQKEYASLSDLLVRGRMGGMVDWDAIVDRVRVPWIPWHADSPRDAVNSVIEQYRLDRMAGQEAGIEVWCEKDALSEVLKRVTSHYGVRLMVNRGYSSCTAMHDAYLRICAAAKGGDGIERFHILYLGDHDPSGLDMVRDIEERLLDFIDADPAAAGYADLSVEHVALTTEQVEEHDPPPNPAKLQDPRATDYVRRHGHVSWEVDALKPEILISLVRAAVEAKVDMAKFNKALRQEKADVKELKALEFKR